MREHSLSGACAYVNDFTEWCLNAKSPPDIKIFVNDRFSKCGNDDKIALCEIFGRLNNSLLEDGKWTTETDIIVNDLIKVI